MNRLILLSLLAGGALLSGCTPPKVLVSDSFMGNAKMSKFYMQQNGKVVKKQALYDLSLRVCDLATDGTQSNCKDSKVLTDVVPQSIY